MSPLSVARGNASLPQDGAYLEKRDPARNMQRYYRVSVAPTLFGEFALVREWGRIGQRGGRRMECWFANEEDALRSGSQMVETKRRRGYLSCICSASSTHNLRKCYFVADSAQKCDSIMQHK